MCLLRLLCSPDECFVNVCSDFNSLLAATRQSHLSHRSLSFYHRLCVLSNLKWRFKEKLVKTTNRPHHYFTPAFQHFNEWKSWLDGPRWFCGVPRKQPSSCGCSFTWRGCFWAVTALPASAAAPLKSGEDEVGSSTLQQTLTSATNTAGSSSSCSHRLPGWGKISFIYVSALIGFNV